MATALESVKWIHGAPDCSASTDPLLQIHPFDDDTFILRQSKCFHYEGNFMYLLFGRKRAILFDSGSPPGADSFGRILPLRATVEATIAAWSAKRGITTIDLIVAHTHSHQDHVFWDRQFGDRPHTTVVKPGLAMLKSFFGLSSWPAGQATLELGGRPLAQRLRGHGRFASPRRPQGFHHRCADGAVMVRGGQDTHDHGHAAAPRWGRRGDDRRAVSFGPGTRPQRSMEMFPYSDPVGTGVLGASHALETYRLAVRGHDHRSGQLSNSAYVDRDAGIQDTIPGADPTTAELFGPGFNAATASGQTRAARFLSQTKMDELRRLYQKAIAARQAVRSHAVLKDLDETGVPSRLLPLP